MIRRLSRWAMLAVYLLVFGQALRAQPSAALRFDNLGIADGLSQSSVNAILQDRFGYMWFCTDDAVNRYDGYSFRAYRSQPDDPRSLPNNQMLAIHEDRLGGLWFVGLHGIAVYDRAVDSFRRILYQPGIFQSRRFFKLTEIGDEIFLAHGAYLYRIHIRSRRLRREPLPGDGNAVICAHGDAELLVRNSTVGYTYNIRTRRSTPLQCGCGGAELRLGFAMRGSPCIVWSRDALMRHNLSGIGCETLASFSDKRILAATFDAQGALWIGTSKGLYYFDTASRKSYFYTTSSAGQAYSLAGNIVADFFTDRTGILWIGTYDGGISKLSRSKFKFGGITGVGDEGRRLAAKSVLCFAPVQGGKMWIGGESPDINVYDPATGSVERKAVQGLPPAAAAYFSFLVEGDVVYAAFGLGVVAISQSAMKVASLPLTAVNGHAKKLLKDGDGTIWACSLDSMHRLNQRTGRFETLRLPVKLSTIRDFVFDDTQNLWIAMEPGLVRYNTRTGRLHDFSPRFNRLFGQGSNVSALCFDGRGELWVGVKDYGLLRYDRRADSFILYGAREGLANNAIYATLADASDNIWLSSNGGLSCFNRATGRFANYSAGSGLQSNEFNGSACFRDSAGKLWFGGINGFNVVDPLRIPFNRHPPQPQITSFRVLEKETPFFHAMQRGEPIRLHERQNYFTIAYSAMDYTSPAENQYRVMLEGFDNDWRPLSREHSITYTALGGGNYIFKVRAYNNDGVPSEKVLELPIHIQPHFYKTWWFFSLIGLVIAAAAVAFYRYRIGQLKRELRLRTSIAADLHDDVGATLSSIKMLSTVLKPHAHAAGSEASGLVDTIHRRASATLEAMSDIVWSINPKNDAGEHLVLRMKSYAAELLDDTDIDYRFVVGEGTERLRFDQRTRKDIYLIYKEALNNATKYADAMRIEIGVRKEGGKLLVEVLDNGKGFDAHALRATTKGGNGLKNMESRAAGIGGTLSIQSSPGGGTKLLLEVPLPHNR